MSSDPQGLRRPPVGTVPASAERPPRGGSAGVNLSQIRLRALPPAEASDLLAGTATPPPGLRWHPEYPMAETLGVVAMLMGAHGATGDRGTGDTTDSAPAWWLHQIVLGDLVVGDTGFHGPPETAGPDGYGPVEVEIGYNVVESLRGRGIATRACRLLLAQAWRDGADAVRAEADEGNEASVRVLLRSGFTELGDRRYRVQRPAEVLR